MSLEESQYNERLWKIVDAYTEDRLKKLREEATELADAIAIHDGYAAPMDDDRMRHHIVDEMVDVQIMIDQVRRRYKVGDDEWNLYRDFKLQRQAIRMARKNGQTD